VQGLKISPQSTLETEPDMLKKLFFALLLLALPCSTYAIEEADYTGQYYAKVLPFYETGTFSQFAGTNGLLIRYASFERAIETGAVIIIHGKSESFIKYAELIYDLQELGLSCYLMDERGFGFSERILDDDPQKVYVERFDDYIDDLKTFVDTIVQAKPHARIFILAHSLGGCIAARYLEKYPADITAAVLSSPMLQIDTGSFPPAVAYGVAALSTALGKGTDYAIGQGQRETEPTFYSNTTTHSFARWSKWEKDLIPSNPEIKSGGATYGWIKRSMEAGAAARKKAAVVETPVLLLQAEEDWFVQPEGQDSFCKNADDCSKVYLFGSRHEILMETDHIRNIALENIKSFLRKFID
jgi:lysophospholipase